jgi:beta-galactosidase
MNVPERFKGKPFILAESTSGLMTRGYYRMPSDSFYVWPVRWDIPFHEPSFACSSYDNCHVPWGTNHEKSWRLVRDNAFISGMYIWTGFDYLGEPTPFWWPARSSFFGIIDLAGFPKDVYYMYQSEWTNKTVLHVFPHWNHNAGDTVDVWAYFNNADEVELFLNGKSLGRKAKENNNLHAKWRTIYEPGSIKAVSYKNGKEVATKENKTAGKAAKIKLMVDRPSILANNEDLAFVTVQITDENGVLVPNADNLVEFTIEGNAEIKAVDNGDPISHERFVDTKRKAFNGLCLAIIKAGNKAGTIKLSAKSEGLQVAEIEIGAK